MDEVLVLDPLGLILTVLGAVLVLAWARFRWSKLKPELFPAAIEDKQDQLALSARNGDPQDRAWLREIPTILVDMRRELEREPTAEMQAPIAAIRRLETESRNLSAAVRSILVKSLESGELNSILLGVDGVFVYIVGVPNRHEYPHLIRRYAPFSAGWIHHANLVKETLKCSSDFSAVISYLFFLSPDAKEGGVLLVSYADAHTAFVPSRLIQETELKSANVRILDAALEFKMSG